VRIAWSSFSVKCEALVIDLSPLRRHKMTLVLAGVLCGIVGGASAVGYLVTQVNPLLFAAALIVPLGVVALARRIELGLVAMLMSAIFVRFRLPTGTASEIVISLLLCGGIVVLWVVHMLVEDKRLSLKPSPVNAPLLGFIVTVVISLIWGRAFRDVLVHDSGSPFVAVAAAAVMILLPISLLLVANLIQDVRWLRIMVWSWLAAGLVSLVVSLAISFGIGPTRLLYQAAYANGVVWINTLGLFSMWYVSLALSLALFHKRLHWFVRAGLLVYVAGWVLWGFGLRMSWLSGWAPVFVAAAVVVFLRSKKLFVLLLVVMVVGAGGYYWRTSFETEVSESGSTRLAAYAVNWRITGKHVLFGTGPAGYASYYMSYFPTEGTATHSNYLDVLAQTGVVGSFFILWFFGAQAWGGYALWRKLKGRGEFAESLSVAVLAGTVGGFLAMGLGDWLFPFAYTQGIVGFDGAVINWMFMGTLWSLYRICR
jgi:O-antigen ligase/polysaccharide polymerase Wzy-like membrane protein